MQRTTQHYRCLWGEWGNEYGDHNKGIYIYGICHKDPLPHSLLSTSKACWVGIRSPLKLPASLIKGLQTGTVFAVNLGFIRNPEQFREKGLAAELNLRLPMM